MSTRKPPKSKARSLRKMSMGSGMPSMPSPAPARPASRGSIGRMGVAEGSYVPSWTKPGTN